MLFQSQTVTNSRNIAVAGDRWPRGKVKLASLQTFTESQSGTKEEERTGRPNQLAVEASNGRKIHPELE